MWFNEVQTLPPDPERTAVAHPLKVLIVAPNASTLFGGESFLPLKYFELLNERGHHARLITHARSREGLLKEFTHLRDRIDFIEDSAADRLVWSIGSRLPDRMRDILAGAALTVLTERAQAKLIRGYVRRGEVDVIHQPIPVSPKQPSAVYGFGVPVVIGPMNGGMRYPKGYEDHESPLAARAVAWGRFIATAMNRIVPGKHRAQVLLVANARTRAALPVRHPRVIELVENAVDLQTWKPGAPRVTRPADAPFRLVFIGRLVDWKCVDITLAAVERARAAGVEVTLDILGDGPERPALQKRAEAMPGAVRFHGFRPQAFCAQVLAGSDALILSSIRECGGAVVLEAMALGLPVIASDWGGPADYLDASCGILVHPEPRADFADRLAAAIRQLAQTPELCIAMGKAGAAKVKREFDWRGKIDRIETIYREAMAGGARP
jgi:glycosyltransferase involved in cell wall biosynthesis